MSIFLMNKNDYYEKTVHADPCIFLFLYAIVC
jgi:hypothetical protein